MFRITYGTSNVICAMISVTKPNSKFILAAKNTNKSISETPVTISGLIIGMFVPCITIVRGSFFILFIPIAAAVPRIVAAIDATVATITVFKSDFIISPL